MLNKQNPFQILAKAVIIVGVVALVFLLPPFFIENSDWLKKIGFWSSVAIGVGTSILFPWVWLTRKQITLAEAEKSKKLARLRKSMYFTAVLVFVLHCNILTSICSNFGQLGSLGRYENFAAYGMIVSAAMQFASLAMDALKSWFFNGDEI
ncbi:hypothetical protein [Giesbergeria anulus]|uniref:Uncharacterized protein n=1 Tax=Giesbergeria anulus TaxID=180197 RepID=A0A1H9NR53_9BURK|nr:hypothetical protein [Giesbergeria anulus]SER38109.1 hypothetical protein SAMN02982919_02303 [Giesbergeria anulus]